MAPATITFLWLTIVSVSVCLLILGIVYLNSKEKMAMIERGMQPRERVKDRPKPFVSFKVAALLAGTGLGLLLAYLIHVFGLNSSNSNNIFTLYFAMIFLGGGAGFFVSYRMEMKYWSRDTDE